MGDALVICGGGHVDVPLPDLTDPFVLAADGGVAEARRLGLHVDVVVGDLDSAGPEDLDAVVAAGGTVERHPEDKDATDLELALDAALARGATRVVVAGGDGGRFDMVLANALLLASPRWAAVELDAVFGGARLTVVRTRRGLAGPPGATVSLFALGGPARGVRTGGLRWSLDGDTLEPGSTRGVSNEFLGGDAWVSLDEGVLVAVSP
jgi:thiamine pyrophosphokinase